MERDETCESDVANLVSHADPLEPPAAHRARVLGETRAVVARPGRRAWRRWAIVTAAGLGVAALAAVLIPRGPQPYRAGPAVTAAANAWYQDGSAVQPGSRLDRGAVLHTTKGGRLVLVTAGGSRLELGSEARLTLTDRSARLALTQGTLYCRSRQHEIRQIATPAGRIDLLGTALSVQVAGRQVRVSVFEGAVRLANERGELRLAGRQQAVMLAAQPPAMETAALPPRPPSHRAPAWARVAFTLRDGMFTTVWAADATGGRRMRLAVYQGIPAGTDELAAGPVPRPLDQPVVITTGDQLCFPPEHVWPEDDGETPYSQGKPLPEGLHYCLAFDPGTGQERTFTLPPDEHCATVLADGRTALVEGKQAVYRYDLATGRRSALARGEAVGGWLPVARGFSQSAGGRTAVVGLRTIRGSQEVELALCDLATGIATDLQVRGDKPALSPDGSLLAFRRSRQLTTEARDGSAPGSDLCLMDAQPGAPVRAVLPAAWPLAWSPDGSRLLCWQQDWRLAAKAAAEAKATDPSRQPTMHPAQRWELVTITPEGEVGPAIYRETSPAESRFWEPVAEARWALDGERIFIAKEDAQSVPPWERTQALDEGLLVMDAQGRRLAELAPFVDSLSAQEREQTAAARQALGKAVALYAAGNELEYDGRFQQSRSFFAQAAPLFAAVLWRHPLCGLSEADLLRFADSAQARRKAPAPLTLQVLCSRRLAELERTGLPRSVMANGHLPASLYELPPGPDGTRSAACPTGAVYDYNPSPKAGEPLVACPVHPNNRIAGGKGWQRMPATVRQLHRQGSLRLKLPGR